MQYHRTIKCTHFLLAWFAGVAIFGLAYPGLVFTQTRPEVVIQTGHQGIVTSVSVSSDGQYLASSGSDGLVNVWDVRTFKLYRSLRHASKVVTCVAFQPNSHLIAAGPWNNWNDSKSQEYEDSSKTFLWDIHSGQVIAKLRSGNVRSLAFHPDARTLATGGSISAGIKLWDVEELKLKKHFENQSANSLAFSRDGKLLAAGGTGSINWFSSESGELLGKTKKSKEFAGEVLSIDFHPDGTTIASGSSDRVFRVWSLKDGKMLQSRRMNAGAIYGVRFGPKGKKLSVVGSDGYTRIYYSDSNISLPFIKRQSSQYLLRHPQMIKLSDGDEGQNSIEIDEYYLLLKISEFMKPDGVMQLKTTVPSDRSDVRTFNYSPLELLRNLGYSVRSHCTCFFPQDSTVAFGSGNQIYTIDSNSGEQTNLLAGLVPMHNSVAFNEEKKILLTGPV